MNSLYEKFPSRQPWFKKNIPGVLKHLNNKDWESFVESENLFWNIKYFKALETNTCDDVCVFPFITGSHLVLKAIGAMMNDDCDEVCKLWWRPTSVGRDTWDYVIPVCWANISNSRNPWIKGHLTWKCWSRRSP